MADKELTFWDHLDELRRVLFRVLGVWFVFAVGYFIAMPWLFDNVVLAPCHNDFIFYDVLRYVLCSYVHRVLDVGGDGYALYLFRNLEVYQSCPLP